jgi:hypothetical protein
LYFEWSSSHRNWFVTTRSLMLITCFNFKNMSCFKLGKVCSQMSPLIFGPTPSGYHPPSYNPSN